MKRRNQEQDFGPEPTFEEFEVARRVIIFVRKMLAEQPGPDAPKNARGIKGRDPLASAEGCYERSHYDSAQAGTCVGTP